MATGFRLRNVITKALLVTPYTSATAAEIGAQTIAPLTFRDLKPEPCELPCSCLAPFHVTCGDCGKKLSQEEEGMAYCRSCQTRVSFDFECSACGDVLDDKPTPPIDPTAALFHPTPH